FLAGTIVLDAASDCVFLIPAQATLDVHVFEAECVLRPDQRWQRANFYVETSFDQLQITLRKGSVDVFHRISGREKGQSDRGQVVGAALQIELPPAGRLLHKHLSIAYVPMR